MPSSIWFQFENFVGAHVKTSTITSGDTCEYLWEKFKTSPRVVAEIPIWTIAVKTRPESWSDYHFLKMPQINKVFTECLWLAKFLEILFHVFSNVTVLNKQLKIYSDNHLWKVWKIRRTKRVYVKFNYLFIESTFLQNEMFYRHTSPAPGDGLCAETLALLTAQCSSF